MIIKNKIKMRGSSHMLLFSVLFLFAALLFFSYSRQKQMVRAVAEYMDDGMTTALMAAGVINREEHDRSRQIIIHNALPDALFETDEESLGEGDEVQTEEGETEPGQGEDEGTEPTEIRIIDAPGIAEADDAVRRSYDIFKSALKKNLRLDDSFRSRIPAIISEVKITEYSVYNVYRNIDTAGEFTGPSRICRYEFINGNWITSVLGEAGSVSIEMTRLAGTNRLRVENSVVSAELTFDVRTMPYNSLFFPEDLDRDGNKQTIRYKRAVDITVHY